MITTIKYRTYGLAEVAERGDGYEIYTGDERSLLFALRYNNSWLNSSSKKLFTAHLEFYAMSEGWERYTSTGYKSAFFSFNEQGNHINSSNIMEIFKKQLSDAGFNFDDPIQRELF